MVVKFGFTHKLVAAFWTREHLLFGVRFQVVGQLILTRTFVITSWEHMHRKLIHNPISHLRKAINITYPKTLDDFIVLAIFGVGTDVHPHVFQEIVYRDKIFIARVPFTVVIFV